MEISDVYLGMGEEAFDRLVRSVSIGKLKTYQMYEGFKVRAHLPKVNTELLRKSFPSFWARRERARGGFFQGPGPGRSGVAPRNDVRGPRFLGSAARQWLLRQRYGSETLFYRGLGRPRPRKIPKELIPGRPSFFT